MSQTPGCWIITGGTNTGVMRHVGKALEGKSKTLIGIATWGIISSKEKLMESKVIQLGDKFEYEVDNSLPCKKSYLDHNHSHFLLVHNGKTERYGGKLKFRSKFEEWIMKSSPGGKIIANLLLPSWTRLSKFLKTF